jgi:hypothetical protein
MEAEFPSAIWFDALGRRMNEQPAKYQSYGFITSRAVFRVMKNHKLGADRNFGVVFDAYECVEVRELRNDEIAAFDADWIFEGSYEAWKEMIGNIKANGAADNEHTLNRLSLLGHPFRLTGADQIRMDLFYREQFSFQAFIDESTAIDTTFAI